MPTCRSPRGHLAAAATACFRATLRFGRFATGFAPLSPDWCSDARLATPLLVAATPAKLRLLRVLSGHLAAERFPFRWLRFPTSSLRVPARP